LTKRISQRGFTLGVGAAVVFLVVATYLAWKLILNPHVNLPRAKNSLGMEFVQVPAGTFVMGSPASEEVPAYKSLRTGATIEGDRGDDEDEHEVEITKPYYLGVYEVSQEQFRSIMGQKPEVFTTAKLKPDNPVTDVTFDNAVEFCRKLSDLPEEKQAGRSYRLPTEAEWEYACRAGGKRQPYSFGSELSVSQANTHANYELREIEASKGKRRDVPSSDPVGAHPANHWGLYAMHGNVMEWCSDWYDPRYYSSSPKQDPTGPPTGTLRVARGGSWGNYPVDCRSATRFGLPPSIRLGMGFRVVMVQENP
jgi:formylglycine-generating enzyme required for sulfatase activity